ncbi:MAG TPA: penicillin-binding protein activator [Fontimonas sp.]
MLALSLVVCTGACVSPIPQPGQGREPVPPAGAPTMPTPVPERVQAWLDEPPPYAATAGGRIALLLPLTGAFAANSAAVRDGVMARHFADGARDELRVYDTGAGMDQLRVAYQRALNDGASMIIGPLIKEQVAQLAALRPPVPVLALNYLDAPQGSAAPFNFYQLGLAPEDEARSAADDAVLQGLRRAVALVPEGDWGSRVLAALQARLQQWNGTLVASARYRPGVSDQTDLISQLMGVNSSEERHRALTAVIGVKSEFDAKRRDDIDFVFLAAKSADARILMPQLRFYRASDLPHYSTSLVFGGRADRDLSGLRFCDMPFMIDQAGELAQQRERAQRLPWVATTPRLYALGWDAYRIASALRTGQLRVGDAAQGASGRFEWSDSSALLRRLECAEMRDGAVLPPRAPVAAVR